MKFSFNEFHLWYQLGLSLMAAGKVSSFLLIYQEQHATPTADIHLLPYLCDPDLCPRMQQIEFTDRCPVSLEKQMAAVFLNLDN